MKKFKIGVQLYSVRDDLEKDFLGTLTKIRDMGYEYVEFAGGYHGHSGEEIKSILDSLGLKSVSVHQGLEKFENEGGKAIEFFKAFGVHYVVIPWYNKEKLPGSPEWENTKALFIKWGKILKENGIELLYHNHDFEFVGIDGVCKYDIMMKELDGYVNPQPDVCWIHYGGQNPADYIRKYGKRIHIVHLKDFNCVNLASGPVYALIDKDGKTAKPASQEDSGFRFAPLGQGRNNWDEILQACNDIDAEYLIVEQDSSNDITPLEAVAQSRKFLREKYGL